MLCIEVITDTIKDLPLALAQRFIELLHVRFVPFAIDLFARES